MKKIKLTWKIWLFLIILVLSLLAIFGFPPTFLSKGVVIKSVDSNSSAFESGLRAGYIITEINGKSINNFEDYSKEIALLFNSNLTQNQTETQIKFIINAKTNSFSSQIQKFSFFTNDELDIIVEDIPKTKIKTGLDLRGGARALVQPEVKLNDKQMQDLIAVSRERFNVYGITDMTIKPVSDLSGNSYMLIEIAGATPKDLDSLISKQGKFEAKIGNETAFVGGNNDITYVCRNDATCSGLESCQQTSEGYVCSYRFVVHLSEEAAKRHADITSKLGINRSTSSGGENYLEKQIDFFVDDQLTTSLFISENLKGQVTTQIQIQGSGSGPDRDSAIKDAEESMKKTQTILITGSLPYKLNIVKLDTISPVLGDNFNYLIILTGVLGLITVSIIVFVKYRQIKSSLALLFTSFSEVVIILGVGSVINWNLDLPSIVGILVTMGTGVDQQIIILDESKSRKVESLKEKMKNALFIVISAFFTSFVSLIPLFWAAAGLLKGFALTTMIGITVGVLISRPAFADIVKIINEKENQ
ncbi:MAG TPA: PDZ domain-containing protein [Candidatus Paceibacterota bacterium]|nr:PDZ domain-containing protein [Candidatus Paceibacterota bacterium]